MTLSTVALPSTVNSPIMNVQVPTVNDLRVKLCYICREEELYDAVDGENPPRAWTHPCKCTLIAHEQCLLKWIQTAQGSSSRAPNALKCPQCGAAYELESKDPWILKFIAGGNRVLQKLGSLFTVFGAATVVCAVGTSLYIICTTYGAWAVQKFIGKEMFDTLLTDDPSNWPWTAFINLPLLPISLILSRFQSTNELSPIIPILLVWPPTYPVGERSRRLQDYWKKPENSTRLGSLFSNTPSPTRSWPPSPVLFSLFGLPIIRMIYRSCYAHLYYKLMGTRLAVATRDRNRRGLRFEEGPFVIRIRANVQEEGQQQDQQQQQQPQQAQVDPQQQQQQLQMVDQAAEEIAAANQDQDPDAAAVAVAAAEQLIEINASSLGRRVGGALMIPAISSAMGSLLFRLSKHSSLLRQFLGVRLGMGSKKFPLPPPVVMELFGLEGEWEGAGLVKQFVMGCKLGMAALWGGTRTWAESDPIWWRNTVGLGLFIAAKDCIHLAHLWLAKRELESRKVKNRDFQGVDIRELDLIPGFPQP
ncbi:uncharacterized protein LACBIDRAFT_318899 [Laccaria bicolor S238N-H82]|uniref:Predicted protein n=1 Tax=Laccaria bicolor (strain S238N-H82 / ATCC MYA-4686) TaxID=486041 RepID=B0D7D6_LACBS|nr:uncharacterized protein LACBIDRAFT_318899 [Laccaria bicolor S238N-H82]EDR09633.1 predicted protein [Laccaria bicolor S238N-H82]|eukprot:XP_001879982.1 predicted protein [Laccaria bicolor S238N-H82]